MKDNMICNKEPIKIEEITRGNIIVSYKGNYYKILGEGLLLSAKKHLQLCYLSQLIIPSLI